jgi:hypothetical protein
MLETGTAAAAVLPVYASHSHRQAVQCTLSACSTDTYMHTLSIVEHGRVMACREARRATAH